MPAAPSIDNYYIGKGRVFWTPEADQVAPIQANASPR